MFRLDDGWLTSLGLAELPAARKNELLRHAYETLEMRVGMTLAEGMTNEQLDEFEAYINRKDDAGALRWLQTNFPSYQQVIAAALEALSEEIKAAAPQILEAG